MPDEVEQLVCGVLVSFFCLFFSFFLLRINSFLKFYFVPIYLLICYRIVVCGILPDIICYNHYGEIVGEYFITDFSSP